jgi:hypothetical protein
MTPIMGLAKHRLPPVDEWGYLVFCRKFEKYAFMAERELTRTPEILVLQFSWKLFTEIAQKDGNGGKNDRKGVKGIATGKQLNSKQKELRDGESNPGLPRDRRGY